MAIAPAMAKEIGSRGQIFSHGSIRDVDRVREAVVEVAVELLPNVHAGQQVLLDVRQGQLRGVVKGVHSPAEIVIALDGLRSKVQLGRLQPGQAVIAAIQLDPECDCDLPPTVPYL